MVVNKINESMQTGSNKVDRHKRGSSYISGAGNKYSGNSNLIRGINIALSSTHLRNKFMVKTYSTISSAGKTLKQAPKQELLSNCI